jgi:DNA anti-recombination protein RmuC
MRKVVMTGKEIKVTAKKWTPSPEDCILYYFRRRTDMKRFGISSLAVIGTICLLLIGCSEQKQTVEKTAPEKARIENLATTPEDIKKEAQDLAKTTMAYTEEQKTLYQKKLQEKMVQYSQELKELKAKMVMLNEQAKTGLTAEMENLNRKKQEMAEKMQQIQDASGEAYTDLKKGLDRSVEEMDKALDEAMSNFRK